MNFMRKWFCKEFEYVEEQKNISEPIFAMLNAWKENPKRFKLALDINYEDLYSTRFYKSPSVQMVVMDFVTKETFLFGLWLESPSYTDMRLFIHTYFAEHRIYPVLGCKVQFKPSWMTQDEMELIIDTVKPYYLKRTNRYREIVEYRQDRWRKASELKSELAKQKERNRLVGVYK